MRARPDLGAPAYFALLWYKLVPQPYKGGFPFEKANHDTVPVSGRGAHRPRPGPDHPHRRGGERRPHRRGPDPQDLQGGGHFQPLRRRGPGGRPGHLPGGGQPRPGPGGHG